MATTTDPAKTSTLFSYTAKKLSELERTAPYHHTPYCVTRTTKYEHCNCSGPDDYRSMLDAQRSAAAHANSEAAKDPSNFLAAHIVELIALQFRREPDYPDEQKRVCLR